MNRIPAFFGFLALSLLPGFEAYAQPMRPMARDSVTLMELATEWEAVHVQRRAAAEAHARRHGLPIRQTFPDGRIMELQYLSEEAYPVYYQTRNAGAAVTTGASQLHPLGRLRLFMTGKGMTAGVWDSGRIYTAHDEFGGRVRIMDGATNTSEHATHVAGTVMAAGVDPRARGMAYEGQALGYDWNSDISEMAAAAADGLLMSNHSYGIVLGWNWEDGSWRWRGHADSTRDYRFGFYSNKSRQMDQIAYNAPHYTIVWAAGNDRNDVGDGSRPPDGPYDCIGPEGVAKNALAIGAVNKIVAGYREPSNVVMSNFSSWGPADDGRVKPDFVAAGVGLYSPIPNNNYGSKGGTSMAAPNATGSLLLLQQLYASQHGGQPMRAATLRALAVQTVHQAGNSRGPDYKHGWGLLNVASAARLILHRDHTDYIIAEKRLDQGEAFELFFDADGSGEVMATIAWTDPPGTPPEPAINPRDLMLVNDLDMRIFAPDGTEYFPWLLDPERPAADPVQADNFRDNVEKVLVEDPQPGTYRLLITHKDTLYDGGQDFSLVLQTRDIPERKTYYWVGSSGEWHDAANWAPGSGGEAGAGIPGQEDHVVFDSLSFSGSEAYQLTVSADAAAYSFSWETEAPVTVDMNARSMRIQSSLYATGHQLQAGSPGTVVFTGRLKNLPLRLPEAMGREWSLVFDNPEGSWTLVSDLEAHSVELRSGTLDMSGLTLNLARISVSGNQSSLDISHSLLDGLSRVDFSDLDAEVLTEQSAFRFANEDVSGEGSGLFQGGGRTYSDLVNLRGKLRIEGQNSLAGLINQAELLFADNQHIGQLRMRPGTRLEMAGGSIHVIEEMLDITGAQDQVIHLQGGDTQAAWLECDRSIKICGDYLHIHNVSVRGEAIFSAGEHSVVEGASQGWLQMDCDDILFADFEADYTCVHSLVHFHDRSTGEVRQWNWVFDLDDPAMPGSTEQHPFYTYADTGYVHIRLRVDDATDQHTSTRPVHIQSNPLSKPSIYVQGNRYTSSTSAPFYQWFLNGQPIPEANGRMYENTDQVPGEYQVMISNNTCNRLSDPLGTHITEFRLPGGERIAVYPNPARDHITLSASISGLSAEWIELLDTQGRVVYRETMQGQDFGQLRIPLTAYRPGVYLLRLEVNGRLLTTRILKQ